MHGFYIFHLKKMKKYMKTSVLFVTNVAINVLK